MFDYDIFRAALRALVAQIYGPITSGEHVNWTPEQQELFNTAVKAIDKVFNKKLRPAYDQAVYDGQDSGKVRNDPEFPVRKRTVKDGAEVKTIPTADDFVDSLFETEVS